MTESAIDFENVRFAWPRGPALHVAGLRLARGERVLLRGPSGSGKSTLLSLVTGVLAPAAGSARVLGADLGAMSPGARDRFRGDHLGVMFQMFNLAPFLSLVDNVALPCRFSLRRRKAADGGDGVEAAARRLLERLGLGEEARADVAAGALSIGQQQRVAAARAFIGAPELIVADEPTSALDAASRDALVSLMLDEASRGGAALLVVSHDAALGPGFDRVLTMNEVAEGRA